MTGRRKGPHPATQLTLDRLRAEGWPMVEKVEHWSPFPPPGHRADLFGFVDVLAVGPQGTLAIQATSRGAVSERLRKAREERADAVVAMLAAGWRLHIWGWHQPRGPRTAWVLGRDVDLTGFVPAQPKETPDHEAL